MAGASFPNAASSVLLRPTLDAQQVRDRRFYLLMAIASTLLVFFAFARSFYLKAYFQTPPLTPLVELHGIVFSIWMMFFVVQTALIASDQPDIHRLLGYAGGVLASGMIVLGTVVAFSAERRGFHQGGADPETNFLFRWAMLLPLRFLLPRAFCGAIGAKFTSGACYWPSSLDSWMRRRHAYLLLADIRPAWPS